ncbi:right-handed parallel beta-helix repeat-containing protein, partial [Patulibacter medicamentivorans]|uniref:right-handed parallel beta-helix repeat-containing protein n=1 Tax=Patulibacter medicamentivorans TaxID=1097667 RepID=UPI00058C8DFF
GGGAGGGAVYLVNQSYWTITGLEVTNDNGTNNITGSNRVGILVNNTSGALKSGITIQGNVVRRVNGCFVCNGADAHFNGGIAVIADPLSPLSTGASSYKDVRILDNVVDHVGRTGIIFGDWSTGLLYAVAYDALSKDITISGNTVTNVDSDGIVIGGAKYNQIDHNVVDNAGLVTVRNSSEPSSGGIWPTKARHTTIEYNEVSRVHTQSTDGQAFDVDLLADDTTLQYNYSHDNEGGFLLLEGGGFHGSGVTARYNLSVNDAYTGAKGVVTFALGVLPNSDIYNNTIYIAPGVPAKPFMQDGWSGTTSTAWSFRNNVVVNLGTGTWSTPTGAHAVVDHNLIHGNHTAGEPADANKITADPQMLAPAATAPAGIGNVSGYQLAATSPAAGSGAVIAGNGGQDFFGRPVSATAAPTRGFHEVN